MRASTEARSHEGLTPEALDMRVTPFPTILLDIVMPVLGDTEWRVLCVVVRQTLGWQSGVGKARKRQDWLSHSQLKQRTGRSSEAVSRAVNGLVQRSLVQVHDSSQRRLQSPQQRRRSGGRLYFSLHNSALALVADSQL